MVLPQAARSLNKNYYSVVNQITTHQCQALKKDAIHT